MQHSPVQSDTAHRKNQFMLQLLATDLVYQTPHPHRRSVHAWHPTLVVLGNGQYLCAFDLGETVESVDYRTYLSRSSDDGQT